MWRFYDSVNAAEGEKKMDAPIASLMAKFFCKGYEKQAKKEEEEAKDIVNSVNPDILLALCTRYDNKTGTYPGNRHEGAAVFEFFERLKKEVQKNEEKR